MSIKETREALKQLSNQVKPLVRSGAFATVNDALLSVYQDTKNKEFNTFHKWKKEGYTIKKGSKAFAVWGRPKKKEKPTESKEGEEYEYYPICYLFSNAQVEK